MGNVRKTAQEMSMLVPIFLRHMYPFVFRNLDVPPSQMIVIAAMDETGPSSLSALAQAAHVSAPTMTGIVDRLVQSQFAKKMSDPKDRRAKIVTLTPKGKRVLQKFRGNIQKRWEYILSKLPAAEQDVPLEFIKKIARKFEDGTI